ncbi:MAG: bifunctional methionine sulfoxide reductase B/A protein [Planctomycetes bacterium]|nr:bifunctional methionine sulfoxide reductase B/A protein [Planctomycetota bacterium]
MRMIPTLTLALGIALASCGVSSSVTLPPPSTTGASSTSAATPEPSPSLETPTWKPTVESKDQLKKRLTPLQWEVTQESGTERPFKNAYWDNHEAGLYVDVVDGTPLFSSRDKFESGTGWPSFVKPLAESVVVRKQDGTHGMVRVEARTKGSDTHLGHVFDDGPKPTGERWCMNSASLRFVPLAEMEKQGYADWIPYVTGKTTDAPKKTSDAAKATETEVAILAGGCFWGMEELIRKQPGVLEVEAGYTGGWLENPKYDDTHDSKSGHAEAVKITFDPKKTTYGKLLDFFFKIHDPTTKDRQGNDQGTQYRSAIFYADDAQKAEAEKAVKRAQTSGRWKKPIVTTLEKASKWYRAEEYHQDYLQKHPDGYTCHYVRD